MPEQIILNIVRPEVGVQYMAETLEVELADRLAASELALHTLALHVRDLRADLGKPCPVVLQNLIDSDAWLSGM